MEGVPRQVLALADVDPTGAAGRGLRSRADDLWVIRPDAFVAARLDAVDQLVPALRRAVGQA